MKTISQLRFPMLAALALLLALPASRGADAKNIQVDVNFDHPEKFTDFKDTSMSTEKGRAYLMSEFTNDIRETAKRYLAPGDHLEVTFTDINLAGEYEPQRGPRFDEVRIMKSIYPPRMAITFKLQSADGKVVAEGERKLIDMNYLMTTPPGFDNDRLRYDKALVNDWMRSEFPKR
ncbi:MAG TPA: DUF3016 domain-containing protein [Candidatus Didemnitutus sp.]|nr:DUF3016 domain-containing protein [Candidatus Didemnitutus sp.]